ncbi:flagellar biosynthetic protein FliQ [Pontivivens ytuae]|uniref:Flagellar biosynthetic protein FliQ n=1 Tax=Pontivivens ytuae TaxID=2789856 RepID=A0A7S9LPU2_9RHOB|nr:flagellar biosynthetic protein FliQ [Pontivivens ytuae]QPH53087.1 flagellar biosynthetic protein FliQ [Pontivivens ytuae]
MTDAALMDLLREGLWTSLVVSLPILTAALVVGLAVGLLQALTSVQEMTLTFVPKLGAILVVFWISMDYSGRMLLTLWEGQILPSIVGS